MNTPDWRFINSGFMSGPLNMALEEVLWKRCQEGTSSLTVRVFGWTPPAISIGYHQEPAAILDLYCCEVDQIDIVRRITGGRAVWHEGEITYSVVSPLTSPFFEGGLSESNQKISQILVQAIQELGVVAAVSDLSQIPQKNGGALFSSPCFASTTRHEIIVEGRKLVGSAQKRDRTIFLQHGSILLDHSHWKITDYMKISSLLERERARKILMQKSIDLESILGRPVLFDTVAQVLFKEFVKILGTPVSSTGFTDEEMEEAILLSQKNQSTHFFCGVS